MKAKQVWVTAAGGAEMLAVRETEIGPPRPDEVLVRIRAAGVLYADILQREGRRHPGSPGIPHPMGCELVGTIEATGTAVDDLTVGQTVTAVVDAGGYAEAICVPAWRCLPTAADVPVAKAAAIVNYWTAYHMLHRATDLTAGDKILIHGASGGVGTALAQLGAQLGLEMIGTASRRKHDTLVRHGVTPIDYRTESVPDRVAAWASDGVAAVFDPIGGGSWAQSYRLLGPGGRLVIYGALALNDRPLIALLPYVLQMLGYAAWPDGRSIRLVGLNPERNRDTYRPDGRRVLDLLAEGAIDPVIAATFPLAEAAEAHKFMEEGRGVGKVVLLP